MTGNPDICSEIRFSGERVCITFKILSLRDLCDNELAKWLRRLEFITSCLGEKGNIFLVVDNLEELYTSIHDLLVQNPHLLDLSRKLGFNNFVCILDMILELLRLNEEIQRIKDKYSFTEDSPGIRDKLGELLDKRDHLLAKIWKYYEEYPGIVATIIDNVKASNACLHKDKHHRSKDSMYETIINELRKSFPEYLEDLKIIPLSTFTKTSKDITLAKKYLMLRKYALEKLRCGKVIVIDGEEMEIVNKILNLGFTIKAL